MLPAGWGAFAGSLVLPFFSVNQLGLFMDLIATILYTPLSYYLSDIKTLLST